MSAYRQSSSICMQILSPFYVFQVFSMIVWMLEDYTIFALALLVLLLITLSIVTFHTRLVSDPPHPSSPQLTPAHTPTHHVPTFPVFSDCFFLSF